MSKELNTNDPFEPDSQETQKQRPCKKSDKVLNIIKALLFKKPQYLWGLILVIAVLFAVMAPVLSTPAGIAVGSWKGVTDGLNQGYTDGAAAGISAEDTTVKIGTKLSQTGKLQVLLLDLKLHDIYEEGSGPQYAALYRLRGEGVFAVDLTQAQVTEGATPDSIIIKIPHPEFTAYLDDSGIETLAEYKAPLFDGTTKNGYTGWLNTREVLDGRVQSELFAYDALAGQADVSAQKQVELLAQSICGNASVIEVRFIEEE